MFPDVKLGLPGRIAVHGDTLIWTNSKGSVIQSTGTRSGANKATTFPGGIVDIRIFNNATKTSADDTSIEVNFVGSENMSGNYSSVSDSNPCAEFNGGCADLCLLYSADGKLGKVCGCADDSDIALCSCRSGLKVGANNRTCIDGDDESAFHR